MQNSLFCVTINYKYALVYKRETNKSEVTPLAKMEKAALLHIAELSKLSFTDEEAEKMMEQMGDIIDLMDTIRDVDLEYDDTADKNEIPYDSLREDTPAPSADTEKLLQNAVTDSTGNCYTIPKMME